MGRLEENATLTKYEELLEEAYNVGVIVREVELCSNADGLYVDGKIAISKKLNTDKEKSCILAEELGHHYTTRGNILDLSRVENSRQELKARKVAYKKLIPLDRIAKSFFENSPSCLYELAENLNVTEDFLEETLKYYESKYGIYTNHEGYFIRFNPTFSVLKTDD